MGYEIAHLADNLVATEKEEKAKQDAVDDQAALDKALVDYNTYSGKLEDTENDLEAYTATPKTAQVLVGKTPNKICKPEALYELNSSSLP